MELMDRTTAIRTFDGILDGVSNDFARNEHFARSYGVHTGLHRLPEAPTETLFKWYQKPLVGNTNPTKVVPHGTHSWTPGDPATFTCQGVGGGQEDNFYFFMKLPTPPVMPDEVGDYRGLQIKDFSNIQALEFQQQITVAKKRANMAYQLEFPTKKIRIWDYKNRKWIETPLDFPDLSQPISFVPLYSIGASGVTHESIEIDGVENVVAVTQPLIDTTDDDKYTISLQVDPINKAKGPCPVIVYNTEARWV